MALLIILVALIGIRRPDFPSIARASVALGLIALSLAAGGLSWNRPSPGEVTVMVDLSASTRTATYRDLGALQARLQDLLGSSPYHLVFFAQSQSPTKTMRLGPLDDLPGDLTDFKPPAAGPVLLFSDGQFSLSRSAPATYVVVDPQLESPADAAVRDLELRSDDVAIRLANSGGPRPVTLAGGVGPPDIGVVAPTGTVVLTLPRASKNGRVSATIVEGDPWPENDALTAINPPTPKGERWWIGASEPGPGWRQIATRAFPTDPGALLSPSVIVLDNVAATDLSPQQQERLRQYLRDFGGGLVLLGGDRSFAAGGYAGSILEALSPLESTPPEPASHWMLLTDSSGSMGSDTGRGVTRWKVAIDAIAKVLPALPPADRVSIGGFARDLNWWIRDAAAKDISAERFPPAGTEPRGPTMLADALRSAAQSAGDSALPSELLLMTDAGATLENASSLAALLKEKKIRLHVLDIGEENGPALPALREIARVTDGRVMQELDPQRWTAAVRQLMQAALPDLLRNDPMTVNFTDALMDLPPARVELWNRVWLKDSAVPLAQGATGTEKITPAARAAGDQRIIAAAFFPTPAQLAAFVRLVERPPRDPRFKTTWEVGSKIRVTIDAVDPGGRYLNNETISAMWINESGEMQLMDSRLSMTAPGRYQWTANAPREPGIVELKFGTGAAEYRSIPGRYPAEFEAIGNNRGTMNKLAKLSGGRVIEPQDTKTIDFKWPTRTVPLSSILASIGTALIAVGLIRWRVT